MPSTMAIIDAYDEQANLTLNTRGFMEGLTKLTSSGAAAVEVASLLSTNRCAFIVADNSKLLRADG